MTVTETSRLVVGLLIVGQLMPVALLGQGRQLRKIEKRPPVAKIDTVSEVDVSRPTRAECEQAAQQIAEAYGPDDLEPWLHEKFPNRAELLDALAAFDLRVSSLAMRIESIESVRVLPWVEFAPDLLAADCLLDLSVGVSFDLEDGRRVVEEPLRSRWRVRFERHGDGEGS